MAWRKEIEQENQTEANVNLNKNFFLNRFKPYKKARISGR